MSNFQWGVFEASLDPVTGAEQKGKRPVLVISNEEFNQAMPNITVLPLTSTKRRLYPSEILLPEGKAGQSLESIVMAHQIRTISKQRLGKLFGFLNDTQIQHEIQRAIKEHLDME
jgi:mRNA interferase MazF